MRWPWSLGLTKSLQIVFRLFVLSTKSLLLFSFPRVFVFYLDEHILRIILKSFFLLSEEKEEGGVKFSAHRGRRRNKVQTQHASRRVGERERKINTRATGRRAPRFERSRSFPPNNKKPPQKTNLRLTHIVSRFSLSFSSSCVAAASRRGRCKHRQPLF